MYTRENLEKRKKLLSNPEIGEAIRAFWLVLDLTKDSVGAICMDDFLIMNIKIQKVLIPGLRINVRDTSSSASWSYILYSSTCTIVILGPAQHPLTQLTN